MGSMSYLKLKHFLCLLVLLVSCVLYSWRTAEDDEASSQWRPSPDQPLKYNYFLLALTWPNGFCSQQKCRPSQPEQQYFTIHGLWPQNETGPNPENCTTTEVLTDNILNELEADLLQYWPSLYDAKNFSGSKGFWKHEWTKHGTCSSDKFPPKQYFKRGIALGEKYHQTILTYLAAQGINPDGSTIYNSFQVLEAIKNGTGKNAVLSCSQTKNGKLQLLEVRLCFNAEAKTLEDCKGRRRTCDKDFIFASKPSKLTLPSPRYPSTHSTPSLGLTSFMLDVEEAAEF